VTAYFDASQGSADLGRVAESFRTHPDVPRVAADVEADVIERFTQAFPVLTQWVPPIWADGIPAVTDLGDGRGVFLKSYTVDAQACTDPAFVLAMKRTIADAITWRMYQEQRNPAEEAKAMGGASVQFSRDQSEPLPRHWDRWLRNFDTREPAWRL
jgi:hypothetical protein